MIIAVSVAAFWLIPQPAILSSKLKENNKTGNYLVEIVFDKPVARKLLKKSISPEVPGLWVFENPVYATHLYRKLVFYPQFTLQPETNYEITLSGIKNFWQITKTADYAFNFKMQSITNTLGWQGSESFTDYVRITGSFPANGWEGVAADTEIKFSFNQEVNRSSARSRFTIEPAVMGTFTWDGNTMIFKPDINLEFNTS